MGVTLTTAILNALVALAYAIFCICFHWGKVNRPALNMFIVTSFVVSGAWAVITVLAGIDVAPRMRHGAKVADDGALDPSIV